MSNKLETCGVDPEVLADLQAIARYTVTGECDPNVLQRVEDRAKQARRELTADGNRDSIVSIIREMRESRKE